MVSGQLRPGDPFPSVRALSKELKINPNTAHKIVAHLVNEGLLETRPGIGTVVAVLPDSSRKERTQLLDTRSRSWWLRPNASESNWRRCSRHLRALAKPQRRRSKAQSTSPRSKPQDGGSKQ
jgi:DNA-binding FadR family transcriptional regulator